MNRPNVGNARMAVRCAVATLLAGLLCCGVALAGTARSARDIAGVRATISQYDNALLDGNGKAGCALMTATAQKQLAADNHTTSCELVFEAGAKALKGSPKEASAIRAYASKVHVTLSGSSASVPALSGGGHVTLTYTHSLWFVSSAG